MLCLRVAHNQDNANVIIYLCMLFTSQQVVDIRLESDFLETFSELVFTSRCLVVEIIWNITVPCRNPPACCSAHVSAVPFHVQD